MDAAASRGGGFQPGMVLGRKYALIRRIGGGGVGSVYEAQDLLVRRRVALKLLKPEYANIPGVTRRFLREARATAAVNHPNVVTILEMGRRQNGSYYIAQELVRGPSLREHLANVGRLEAGDALDIMLPVMSALWAAHRRGIVHRDVKPGNILLATGPNGEMIPKLVDFGSAKVAERREGVPTQAGAPLGTPNYMAPEQVRGAHDVDARVDVWAVGVVLSELVSGRLIFADQPGDTPAIAYGQILHEADARIGAMLDELPAPVAAILAGALRPDPDARYPTMNAFRRELVALAHAGAAAPELTPPPPAVSRAGLGWVDAQDPAELWSDDDDAPLPQWRQAAYSIPPDTPELAFSDRTEHSGESALEDKARAAEHALGDNALEEAIAGAEEVLAGASEELWPRMWLVYTVAELWLGNYAECERGGRAAMEAFAPRTTGWYVALGHVASACGSRGESESLAQLCEAVAVEPEEPSPARDVAVYRLAVAMMRAGEREQAERLVELVRTSANAAEHALVYAWREVVLAELATHAGDVSRYLTHTEAATEHFTYAGDVRNACLQQHNIGNALMQLGAYERAEMVFREVLDVGEPMRLNLVPAALANLGFTLSRLDALDTAWEIESRALELCAEQGYRRLEAVASLYLALILAMKRDLEAAVQLARNGVTLSATSPPTLAQAHAVLAAMLLLRDESKEALSEARLALELLNRLGGVEEGEALIRLVYMSALAREGDAAAARNAAIEARTRLLERADRIAHQSWRRSFLNNVPEHARTMELAAAWLDEGRDSDQIGASPMQNTLLGLGRGARRAARAKGAPGPLDTQPGLGKPGADGR